MADDIKLTSLAAFAQELTIPIGLTLTEVEVQTGAATFVDGNLKLAEPGRVTVRISASALTAFVASQLPPMIRNLQIEFRDGLMRAAATAKVVVEVSATAVLKPVVVDGKELHLQVADFEGPGVARGIMEKQLENQNPVFKASDVPFPLILEKVSVTEFLEIEGTWNIDLNENRE